MSEKKASWRLLLNLWSWTVTIVEGRVDGKHQAHLSFREMDGRLFVLHFMMFSNAFAFVASLLQGAGEAFIHF